MKVEELTKLIIKELKEANENLSNIKKEDVLTNKTQNLEEENLEVSLQINKTLQKFKDEEKEFLHSIKDRILVLFEGLNNFDKGDIEARVELNLKFMEFLLATIEERLDKLQ